MFFKSKLINILIFLTLAAAGGIFGSFVYNTTFLKEEVGAGEAGGGGRAFLRERFAGLGLYSPGDVSRLNTYAASSAVSIFRKKSASGDALGRIYPVSTRLGIGLAITSDGWIVTQPSVLKNGDVGKVVINFGNNFYEITRIVNDPLRKVTYAKVAENNLQVIKFGDSDEIKFGETVFIVGGKNQVAVALVSDLAWRATAGKTSSVLSSENNSRRLLLKGNLDADFIGAPALNIDGEVVGVIERVNSGGNIVLLPINNLKRSVQELLLEKKFSQIYLGLSYLDLNSTKGQDLPSTYGFLVYANPALGSRGVIPQSPAERAGLALGDVIVKIQDREVRGPLELSETLDDWRVNETVNFSVKRDSRELLLKAVLEER